MASKWLYGTLWGTVLAVGLTGLATERAAAQQQAPDSPWIKVCQNVPQTERELCIVTQEVRAETGQFIASATLRKFSDEDKISFVIAVPVGMLLEAGINVQIDDQEAKNLKYGICFTQACFGELVVDDAFISNLKRGGQLVVSALNQQKREVKFPLTLSGFTKTYDGEGVDPTGGQAQQQKLNEALQKRAEEARQRLIEQQQGGN